MEINNTYMVTENTSLDSLILGAAGKLEPPEGKLLTVVVNGVEVDPVPGEYTGDIRLIITDYIDAPIEGMHARPGDPPEPYRAALLLGSDGPSDNAASAAYVGGSVDGTVITGGKIASTGECFNNLIVTGGSYEIHNLTIENTGHSVDDGKGLGCGILAGGDSETTFENLTIANQGIRNDAIVTGGTAKMTIKNSTLICAGGTPEQIQAVHKIRPGISRKLHGKVRQLGRSVHRRHLLQEGMGPRQNPDLRQGLRRGTQWPSRLRLLLHRRLHQHL